MLNFKIVRIHLIGWSIFISYELLVNYTFQGHLSTALDMVGHYLLNITIFYLHYIILEQFLSYKNTSWNTAIPLVLSELAIYFILKYLLYLLLIKIQILDMNVLSNLSLFIMTSLWRALYFIGLSTCLWFAIVTPRKNKVIANLQNIKLNHELEKEILEKKILNIENSFFKAQINPHFLFNILGFIYNDVAVVSRNSGEMIMILSDMMRYALSKPHEDNLVLLNSEIEYIENYIEINTYRFESQLNIQFSYNGEIENIRILPMLLVTILENVFKYGDLRDATHPAIISIVAKSDYLSFIVKNKKNRLNRVIKGGIGMENVINRLNLQYGEQYKLNIVEDENEYNLELLIPYKYD